MTAHSLDTGTPDLIATLEEGVLTLTLNRPEARNAMSKAMNKALASLVAEVIGHQHQDHHRVEVQATTWPRE